MNRIESQRKVLGKGLNALLSSRTQAPLPPLPTAKPEAKEGAQMVPLDAIDPNPLQPRRTFEPNRLEELAQSIRANGVVQPLVVRRAGSRYQLVAGERRWLACKLADKSTIPAIVREISNEQAMEITIIENLQREDLNPVEQARAFERLSREFGLTQEQIASRTGKDRASIANFIRLLKLPDEVQTLMESGELTFGHGKVLCALTGFPDLLAKAAQAIVTKSLSVRQTEELVATMLNSESAEQHKPPQPRPIDPNVREAARTLEQALGVKVEIKDYKGKGKIILKYASLEDFDRIVEALGQKLH